MRSEHGETPAEQRKQPQQFEPPEGLQGLQGLEQLEHLEARAARQGHIPRAEAMALFDALPPVTVAEMLGPWKGSGLSTGHDWDGLLETFGWHGKLFVDPESAHPLVFEDSKGLFSVDPALLPLGAVTRFPQAAHVPLLGRVGRGSLRLFRTSKPRARLRMVEYRGVTTGTMCYDALPINDHFRKVGDNTLLGAMDMRGVSAPFMFVLRREG
ncbi:DUF4334 domain-containing protein [Nocardiopsis sp. HNM0947]|uniref:DUF4334 domain-containing protein n=1 Tax=Nocardiopsis coralli TaxID=2772213 RepID=A0ABR9PF49_9ACTN|nr:DUF4334 domain-containing protein [Nocardiopsis coralli]MBE3002446.1 DUF4334 domain-containing protein [Nocardiopsis coralli]